MKLLKTGELVLENVRVNFCSIATPDDSEFGKGRYQLTIFEQKGSKQINELKTFVQNLMKSKNLKFSKSAYNPLKDGDTKYKERKATVEMDTDISEEDRPAALEKIEIYKGVVMIKCASKKQPKVVDKQRRPLNPEDIGLNGALVDLLVTPWIFRKPGVGLLFILNAIQVKEEGTAFGSASVEDAFSMYEDETEENTDTNDSMFSEYDKVS